MDCEKYEPLLLDELYEELDEVTSAAIKRHCAGCARCASALNDMRATRRDAVLPMVRLPDGLEDRILAATKEAQRGLPVRIRLSGALSLAGRWAMRPQTAMAAVFLLMIGSSAFVIRARKDTPSPAAVSVTEHGAPQIPAQASVTTETASLDDPAAAAAHGASRTGNFAPPPAVAAVPLAAASIAASDDDADNQRRDLRKAKDETGPLALREHQEKTVPSSHALPRSITNAGSPAGAPPPPAATAAADEAESAARGAALARSMPAATRGESQDGFSMGMASYRARNYGDATRQFDHAAQTGDMNAALWAAKSVKDGSGCAPALSRFEAIAQKAGGAWVGHEAELEAARCHMAMGQLTTARARLDRLSHVQSHAQQAQSALAELDQVASRKSSGAATGGAAAPAPAKATRPAAKPAAPATAVDHGF